MRTLNIDNELKAYIPALTAEEKQQLTANILAEGVRDAIVLAEYPSEDGEVIQVIADGHNRYSIATEYSLPFNTETITFDSYADVKEWMIKLQFGRRNLNNYQRGVLALQLSSIFEEKALERKREAMLKSNLKQGRPSVVDTHTDMFDMEENGEVEETFCTISDKTSTAMDTGSELSKIANLGRNTIAQIKKIETLAGDNIKAKLQTGEMSVNAAYKEVRKEEKKEELKQKQMQYEERIATTTENEFKIDIYDTDKKFRVIYADPAWSYNDKQNTSELGGAAKHYDTMSISDICALPVKDIAEDNAVLFLWVTSPLLEDSFKVIKEWGFKYKTSFVWDKVKHNMGHYNSVRHELLLVATKGSCTPDNKVLHNSVQRVERNDNHSEKPIEFLDIIDEIYTHGFKLEMFCRNIKKDNWFGWGNEL
jgi:N6-adenosine-specific RNA methylase IME4